jgi:ankyrin repeat protein
LRVLSYLVLTHAPQAGADAKLVAAKNRESALHENSRSGSVEIAKLLLDAGADVNLPDTEGALPCPSSCVVTPVLIIIVAVVRSDAAARGDCDRPHGHCSGAGGARC